MLSQESGELMLSTDLDELRGSENSPSLLLLLSGHLAGFTWCCESNPGPPARYANTSPNKLYPQPGLESFKVRK